MWSYWPVRQWMQTHTHTCTHTSNVPFLLVLQVCVCESVHDLCRIKTASSPDTMLIYSSFYMFFCLFTHRNRLPFCISVFSCLFHYLSLFPLSPALLYLSSLSPTASYLLFSLKKKKHTAQTNTIWSMETPYTSCQLCLWHHQTYSMIINYSDSTGLYDTCSHYRVEHAQVVLTLTKHLEVTKVYVVESWMVKVHETSAPNSVFSVLSGAVCVSSLSLFWHQSIHASIGAERYPSPKHGCLQGGSSIRCMRGYICASLFPSFG